MFVLGLLVKKYKVKERLCKKISETPSIKRKSQHWGGNKQLSMEGISVEYFTSSFDPGKNEEKYEFHSYISEDNEQYACDSHAYMFHLL